MRIHGFKSPHFDEYKNSYDFLKLTILLKPLFSRGAGFVSNFQNFVLEGKTGYFFIILDVSLKLVQVESC